MIFQTAGIEVSPWLPPLVAFGISFFTSMAGVSGAFLLLPFQMSVLGYVNPSVSATNQVYNLVAIPSGVYRYYKEGRMFWPLAWGIVLGTLPGVFIGAFIRISYLPDPARFKLFAAMILGYIGLKMGVSLLRKNNGQTGGADSEKRFQQMVRHFHNNAVGQDVSNPTSLEKVTINRFDFKRISGRFYGQTFEIPFINIFALSFVVGIIGGIYGIGGGAIIAPFIVAIWNLPVYMVAGAALMGTLMTSVAGVIFYQAIAPFYPDVSVAPDWLLGALFGLGGMAGMYLGAYCQKFVPARAIKWMLVGIILFTALKYTAAFFGR